MKRVLLLSFLVLACAASGPVPLKWGEESCRHCHMTLADRRFGAEVVTMRGRALSFDDAGCAANHLASGATPAAEVSSVWAVDFTHPATLLAVDSATFVRSDSFRTPMGSGVVAVPSRAAADSLAGADQGVVLSWDDIMGLAHAGKLGPL